MSRNRKQTRTRKPCLGSLEHLEAKRLMAGDLISPVEAVPVLSASEAVVESAAVTSHSDMSLHDLHIVGGNDNLSAGSNDGSGTANRMMCDAHPDNPELAAEHCAAMNLARPEDATHVLVASGDWSEPANWANGVLPGDKARVHIPAGITVTVDRVDPTTYATIRVDGTLRFAPNVNTELRVDTIVSSMHSRVEMGTQADPIRSDVKARIVIADCGEIDRINDPLALGRGAILHGETVINGAAKTSWSTTSQALAGDRTLTLAQAPSGWQVGDSLVVAGTRLDASGEEVATIQSIDGNAVTLSAPLTEDHVPPAGDLSIHVANTTRNAVIQSESTAISRRGHVMFMHNPNVQIAHAGFYDLGRTDKSILPNPAELDEDGQLVPGTGTNVQGRYSVHFHRQGVAANTPKARVEGSALVGSPGWGYVNHSSHVDIVDNVSFDVFGAAFYTEAGDEIGSFVNNLSIKTHGTGLPPNDRDG
ncbi:MAG: G8 domain-containing protein, partial [Planctomycetota bacterium]